MRIFLATSIVLLLFQFAEAQSSRFYKPGYYYNTSGQKKSGLIYFQASRDLISFKTDDDAKAEKIKIENINSVFIETGEIEGDQSYVVLTEDHKNNKRYFGKLVFTSPVNRFYYKFLTVSYGGTAGLTTLSNVPSSTSNGLHSINMVSISSRGSYSDRVVMYSADSTTYELTKKNYIEVLSKSFADVPDLAQQILDKKYKFKQLYDMIELYKNKTTYKEN